MEIEKKIKLLEKVIKKAYQIKSNNANNPEFISWKNLTERTLSKVFGENSHELRQFKSLLFCYDGMVIIDGHNYTSDDIRIYREDMTTTLKIIESYIEEFNEEKLESIETSIAEDTKINKVFISHSTKDYKYVKGLVELLESLGLKQKQIFCTSFEEYGLNLGENFLNTIKDELNGNVMVLLLLSDDFYESPVCLCEMGAAWALTKKHIPILIPPFKFENIKGVISNIQGFLLNDSNKLNTFKDEIEKTFDIEDKIPLNTWERKKKDLISMIND